MKYYKSCGFGWLPIQEYYAKTILNILILRKDWHEILLVETHNCA